MGLKDNTLWGSLEDLFLHELSLGCSNPYSYTPLLSCWELPADPSCLLSPASGPLHRLLHLPGMLHLLHCPSRSRLTDLLHPTLAEDTVFKNKLESLSWAGGFFSLCLPPPPPNPGITCMTLLELSSWQKIIMSWSLL